MNKLILTVAVLAPLSAFAQGAPTAPSASISIPPAMAMQQPVVQAVMAAKDRQMMAMQQGDQEAEAEARLQITTLTKQRDDLQAQVKVLQGEVDKTKSATKVR